MQATLRALQSLQELDQQIFKLREELRRLPEERAQRRAQIDAAAGRLEQSLKAAREQRIRIKEIEDETTQERQRMRKVEHEASTSRSDMALLAAYQHEIKTLKRNISAAEELGLQLVDSVEAAEAETARMKAEIEAAEQVFGEFCRNADLEAKAAQSRLDDLLGKRVHRISDTITPESMLLYDRLVSARGGVALAELDRRICQACFMEVPTNLYVRVARGAALAQCPSCDRILYLRE